MATAHPPPDHTKTKIDININTQSPTCGQYIVHFVRRRWGSTLSPFFLYSPQGVSEQYRWCLSVSSSCACPPADFIATFGGRGLDAPEVTGGGCTNEEVSGVSMLVCCCGPTGARTPICDSCKYY